jgi:CheY-like chemotaxis protein
MSHEIRTPMNAINGMTAIGKSATDVQRKDYCFGKIEDASRHLLGVINDILDMSKIEANKFELSETEFNYARMLQRVINITAFRSDEKDQIITVHIDDAIPRILIGDDQRLAQVITNLLSNAVKFTPNEGFIKVDTELVGEHEGDYTINVTVTDSGIGISPKQQEQLFKAFRQADSTTSRLFGGSGLGLVISKSIIEMMGGQIKLKSEVGKGSEFSFTFKAKRGSYHPNGHNSHHGAYDCIDGIFDDCRILITEDVAVNTEIIEALIEPTGLKSEAAENGIAAVKKFEQSGAGYYDLILMDVQMPEMDGYEATGKIRESAHPDAKTIPIVAMTANVFRESVERCLASGMNAHIGKPFDIDELFGVLRKYLI